MTDIHSGGVRDGGELTASFAENGYEDRQAGRAPTITCVIPTYESIELAARAITSAVAQRGVDVEVIVSDDSRSSVVADLVAALSPLYPSLRYVRGPQSGNPVENWNHGLRSGQAPFLILLHHDEFFIDPEYLARAVDFLMTHNAIAVRARSRIITVNGNSRFFAVAAMARLFSSPDWTIYCTNWIGATACVVFRTGATQLFDAKLVQTVDVDFYHRLIAANGSLALLPGLAVGSLARHEAQISTRIDGYALALAEVVELQAAGSRSLSGWQWEMVRIYWQFRKWLSRIRK